MTSFPTTYFQRLTVSCLSVALISGETNLESNLYKLCDFNKICLQQTEESEKYIVSKNIHTS